MKKVFSTLMAVQIFSSTAWAGMPQFPADKIDKLEQLSNTEQAEAGAFMLFYDLVSQGKIGGNSGLCVSYEPGDAGGTPDKISIGLDSKSYPTGIASIDQVPKEKLENLKLLMKQIGRYLDSGCEPGKEAECKAGRNVSITGYADAQHYGSPGANAGKVETSIMKNIELAQNRASLFSQVINGDGFVNPNQVKSYGKASPIGEYLMEGLPIPSKYNPDGKTFSASNYRKNCPERRVTVIDVEFNAKKVETNSTKGVISPSVKSASASFVKLASLGATVQTLKAATSLNLKSIKDDKDADKVIDKIMEMNGITNPEMKAACKNMQTRTMVKEHLSQIPSNVRTAMDGKSEAEILRLAQMPKNSKSSDKSLDLITYFSNLNSGFGGIENLNKYPLLTTTGQSTTLNDCFSAKAAMQAEFTRNPSLRKDMCKPVDEFKGSGEDNIDIKFHPKELDNGSVMHIGCQACQTGFRYVPKKYINPETGKEETQMLPVFVDREANISDKTNPELSTYRPVGPVEVNEMVTSSKTISDKVDLLLISVEKERLAEKDKAKKADLLAYKNFLQKMKYIAVGTGYDDLTKTIQAPSGSFKMNQSDDVNFQKYITKSGIKMDDYHKSVRMNQILNKPIYGAIEKEYLQNKMKGYDNQITKRYEQVILPGIKARDILTNWDGKNADQDANNMLFGSLKKPRYYMLDDCNCDSPNLLEQAVTKGKAVSIDPVPFEQAKQKVGKNACLISIPVPPSCMVAPNEAGANGEDQKPAENRIKWMGLNGENMDKAISEMKTYFEGENKKMKLTGCEGLPPMAIAQKIVDSAECSGENALPQAEELDCKK